MKRSPDLLDVLLPTDRATVSRACAAVGVRSHLWRRVRWIRLLVEVLSIDTLSGRLELEGCSRSRAVEEAARRLGLNPESYRQRGLRARRAALEPAQEMFALPTDEPRRDVRDSFVATIEGGTRVPDV